MEQSDWIIPFFLLCSILSILLAFSVSVSLGI